jgi:hypothetical protein
VADNSGVVGKPDVLGLVLETRVREAISTGRGARLSVLDDESAFDINAHGSGMGDGTVYLGSGSQSPGSPVLCGGDGGPITVTDVWARTIASKSMRVARHRGAVCG